MPAYNPNSVWDSKEKQYVYVGKGEKAPTETTGGGGIEEPPQKADNFFKRHGLIFFGVGLLVVLIAIVVIIFVRNHPAPQLTINFEEPDQVLVGDPFIVTVSFSNDSDQALANAQLAVLLPDGISFLGQPQSQRVIQQAIGSIDAGKTSSQTFNVIATGNPSSVQHVSATMTYGSVNDPQGQFQSNGQTNVVVGDDALKFSFGGAPQSVFSGQNFPITVTYNNQSPDAIPNAQFVANYPGAFSIVSSSANFIVSGNSGTWDLGTVSAGASSSLTVVGNFTGPASSPYALNGTMSGVFDGQTYIIAAQTANVTIAQAPLSLSVALNNASNYISKTSDNLNYTLTYTNNSNVTFQSANIVAKLTGTMFDFSKLQTDGSFNSVSDTITWNAASEPELTSLAPGESGSVNFSVATKTAYPIRLVSDKNFVLKVIGTITSPTVPPNTAGGSGTQSIVELDTKVAGAATIAAQGYLGSGPYPPKVNQATTYTIHWVLANYATDIANVTVSASLQSGSSFTGVVTSTFPSSTPTYDPGTGLVTWTIPSVAATTGVLGAPLEATFQISNTPAVNQVNQLVTLLGPTTLTASDTFTGATLTASDQPVTTELQDDPSVAHVSNKEVTQ